MFCINKELNIIFIVYSTIFLNILNIISTLYNRVEYKIISCFLWLHGITMITYT